MTHELQSRHQPKELLESNPVMKKGSNSLPEAEKNSPIKSRAKVLVETLVGVGVINPKMDTFTFEGGQELAVLPLSRSELNKVVKVFDEFRTTFADFADFAEMCDYDPGKLDQYFQSNSEQLVKLHNSEAVGQGLAQMDDLLKKLADPDEEVDRVVSPKTINEKIILMTRLSNELNPWYERSEDKRATVDTKVPEITRDAEGNLDKVYFDTKSLNPTIVKEMMNLDNKWVLYNSDGILYNTNQLLKDLGLGDLSPDELSSHLAEDGSLAKIRLRRNEISENLKQKLVEVGGVFCVDFKHPDHDQDINQKNKEDPIEPEPQKPEPLAIDGNDFGDSPEPNSIPGLDDETSSEYIEGNLVYNPYDPVPIKESLRGVFARVKNAGKRFISNKLKATGHEQDPGIFARFKDLGRRFGRKLKNLRNKFNNHQYHNRHIDESDDAKQSEVFGPPSSDSILTEQDLESLKKAEEPSLYRNYFLNPDNLKPLADVSSFELLEKEGVDLDQWIPGLPEGITPRDIILRYQYHVYIRSLGFDLEWAHVSGIKPNDKFRVVLGEGIANNCPDLILEGDQLFMIGRDNFYFDWDEFNAKVNPDNEEDKLSNIITEEKGRNRVVIVFRGLNQLNSSNKMRLKHYITSCWKSK